MNRTPVGIYYAYMNYYCVEGPFGVDLINSGFMVLSSFWTVAILQTIGMKFASMFKSDTPSLIKGYVCLTDKLSKSMFYKVIFHGSILMICTIIPFAIKVRTLMSAS